MRVLIGSRMGAGHFGPLIPFAHALLRAGAEVLVTAPVSAAAMIAEAGLDHEPIPDPPQERRAPILHAARGLSEDDANARIAADVFIRIDTPAAYPHVRRAIAEWEPDVVLYDVSEFAAGLAAEDAGVPAVNVRISQGSIMQALGATIAAALDEVRADLGLEPDPQLERLGAAPTFTLIPEALEEPIAGPHPLRFREPAPREPRPLPAWWPDADRPLVYLTFGSVAPQMDYFPGLYRAAVDALSDLPIRLLVTIGRERDPAELGDVTPNVHVARWVPQIDVMPHAAAMVCHGGSGTVSAGLAAGVPMVVVPLFADQPHNARRVAELGAGISLAGPEPIARLRGAVARRLGDRSYRDTAERIAAGTRRLPPVDAAPAILRDLATRRAA